MQISGHYEGFPEKTLAIIMNHERARFFCAHHHDFVEQAPIQRTASEQSTAELLALYTDVYQRMEHAVSQEDFSAFLVCIPEIHRVYFQENFPASLKKHPHRIIPKNLSAMKEDAIIRIIFEG